MIPDTVYHWSPTSRRDRITTRGLAPRQACLGPVATQLGTTPAHAWYIPANDDSDPENSFDLWQVTLADGEAFIRTFLSWAGPAEELVTLATIPPQRLWLVGSRDRDLSTPQTGVAHKPGYV